MCGAFSCLLPSIFVMIISFNKHLLCLCERDFLLEVRESVGGGADLAKVHFDYLLLGKTWVEDVSYHFTGQTWSQKCRQ